MNIKRLLLYFLVLFAVVPAPGRLIWTDATYEVIFPWSAGVVIYVFYALHVSWFWYLILPAIVVVAWLAQGAELGKDSRILFSIFSPILHLFVVMRVLTFIPYQDKEGVAHPFVWNYLLIALGISAALTLCIGLLQKINHKDV